MTIKSDVFAYLDEHPKITLRGLYNRFKTRKQETLKVYYYTWKHESKDADKLREILKTLLDVLYTKTKPVQQLSKKEQDLLELGELMIKT